MEFNCEIRNACRALLELLTHKKISEDCASISGIIRQLKQDYDYITEQEVKKSIDGIQHKFDIHAEYEKSRHFQRLVTDYIQLTAPTGLTHPTWSILYLLIRLAYRPTEKMGFTRKGCILENLNIENEKNDEHKYIEDVDNVSFNEDVIHSMSRTALSNWTDSEDDDNQLIEKNDVILPKSCVVNPSIPVFCSFKKSAVHNSCLNELVQKKHGNDPTSRTWTDFQLLHEVLWALQQSCDNNSFVMLGETTKSDVQTITISLVGLPYLSLEFFRQFVEELRGINLFFNKTSLQETCTLTHQAYAAALASYLAEFKQSVSSFEMRVAEQKTTITLSHLLLFLKPWASNISKISAMHKSIMQMSSVPKDNNTRFTHLLSVLFDSTQEAQVASYSTLYPVLLKILCSSLEPFLNMVDLWLSQGQIVDPYQEFGIIRNEAISPQDERFWFESLLSRPTNPSVNFLKPLMDDILLGGRSVELLTKLRKEFTDTNRVLASTCCSKKLVEIFQERFNRFASDRFNCAVSQSFSIPVSGPFATAHAKHTMSKNPLLTKAFKSLRKDFCPNKYSEDKKTRLETLSIPPEFYPLLPLLEKSLLEPMRSRQRMVCKALLDTLYENCSLRKHILILRQIHFMQAGDLMGRFCLQLFQKFKIGDKWDNESSLTLSLLNCISPRMGQSAPYLFVNIMRGKNQQISAVNLTDLQINYKVPWPINLVITQKSLIFYNSVLCFLMKIKQAMFSLQRLSFKELSKMEIETNDHLRQKEILSSTARRHRLQLLRAWLLYFVSSVDNYIMECVLESSHIRMDKQLEDAVHLGQIIDIHHDYVCSIHKQCLQEPSGAFLRDAIDEVLSISMEVANAWNVGIGSEKLTKLEENYVKLHQYVAAILGTDSAHSMLPLVETLAVALIHSCPATQRN